MKWTPNIRSERQQEQREKEPVTEVARVFLFQAISPDKIPDTADMSDPKQLCFTHMMLIRKAGIASRGKLMPVGGKISPGETPSHAAIREVVEETHLRMTSDSTKQLTVTQEYSFFHAGQQKEIKREAHFFVGQVLPQPLEQAYPLHNEEDKIAAFDFLTIQEYEELAEMGTLIRDNGATEVQILDSLSKNPVIRDNYKTYTEQHEVDQVHTEVTGYFKKVEARKKIQVLRELIHQSLQSEEYASLYAVIAESSVYVSIMTHRPISEAMDDIDYTIVTPPRQQLDDLFAILEEHIEYINNSNLDYIETAEAMVHQLWQVVQDATSFTSENVREALQTSNTRATMENVTSEKFNDETGMGLPSIQLLFPLLTDSEVPLSHGMLRAIAENPHAARLLRTTSVMKLFDEAKIDPNARKRLVNRIKGANAAEKGQYTLYLDDVKQFIVKKGYVVDSNEYPYNLHDRLNQLGGKINRYFERLKRAANIPDSVPIDQLNEIKNASFDELLAYAFGTHEDFQGLDERSAGVYKWEARRKLMLIQMLHEIDLIHRATINRGVKPIDDIERSFRIPGITHDGIRVLQCGDTTYRTRIVQRQKDLMQLLRKSIVRDEGLPHSDEFDPKIHTVEFARDVYGEAYVFMDEDLDMTIREYSALPGMTDGKNRVLDTYSAPKPLHDLISSIVEKGGDAVRITQFKELPAEGAAFDSKGSGGGGNIRMAKFYIEHTDADGIQRHKEVQCFFPRILERSENESIRVSGQYDFFIKKEDDKNYGVSRLFKTKAHRSFIEELYPVSVYGDSIQPAFKGQV